MKKMYNQPIVESTQIRISGQTLCASSQFGGGTNELGGGEVLMTNPLVQPNPSALPATAGLLG